MHTHHMATTACRAPPFYAAPSESCALGVCKWAHEHYKGFFVGKGGALKRVTLQLQQLLQCVGGAQQVVLVDVGAGIWGITESRAMRSGGTADDSDSLLLLSNFGERAHVHAFEANAAAAAMLQRVVARRPTTRNFTTHYSVHAMGMGATATMTHVAQCGQKNRWTLKTTQETIDTEKRWRCGRGASIEQTSFDVFAERYVPASAPLLYAKVDVEGGEMLVLEGMRGLLSTGRGPAVMSFEYGVGWAPVFGDKERKMRMNATQLRARNVSHSLFRFQTEMAGYGYDTFLLHHSRGGRVTLVPVWGGFWHDDLEICANQQLYQQAWCWNDLLVVSRCHDCVRRVLLDGVTGGANQAALREYLRAQGCEVAANAHTTHKRDAAALATANAHRKGQAPLQQLLQKITLNLTELHGYSPWKARCMPAERYGGHAPGGSR